MKTTEFDYHLPQELIAQKPVEPRDTSRLMVVERSTDEIHHRRFRDLDQFLRPGDLLIHNDTRVIPARIYARKPTGGRVELLLLRPRSQSVWEALVGGRRIRPGLELTILDGPGGEPVGETARVLEQGERGLRVLAFDGSPLDLAEEVGETPLPPYIHEPLQESERYQTVYARAPGSAAAPTAGLHFTPELLLQLRDVGVKSAFVTLHVGLDTFQPVREERIENHTMHSEYCTLSADVAQRINQAKLEGRRVFAVGTTAVRVLETAARAGLGTIEEAGACPMRAVSAFEGETDLFIYPGFDFRVVDGLITNFHLPRSTLLMLVAAFCDPGGTSGIEMILSAYRQAVENDYRFYSYGDAMLIL